MVVPPFMAIASGISYHPSMVNSRKMEYTLSAGLPKYCGAAFPKRNVVMMLKINNRTIKPIATMYEALNANFTPFRRLSTFGINFSIRNDLNARIVLSDNSIFVPGKTIPKRLIQDGSANRTRMKSNLFQPSDQYPEKPRERILTTASTKKSKVNKLSMKRNVPS